MIGKDRGLYSQTSGCWACPRRPRLGATPVTRLPASLGHEAESLYALAELDVLSPNLRIFFAIGFSNR